MNVPVALRRLWIQLTADRRRFGLFCAMLGVGLLLWARLIVITNTPRTVVADDKSQQTAQTEQPKKTKSSSQAAAAPATEGPKTPLQVVLATTPQRDPFVISAEHYPRRMATPIIPEDEGKFPSDHAEDSLEARYARMAERLKLEAIMSPGGGQPLVVINGTTYRINDEVPVPGQLRNEDQVHFRIVQVAERTVIVEYAGYQFERTLRKVMSEKSSK